MALLTAFSVQDAQIGLTLLNVSNGEIYSLYIRNLRPHFYILNQETWQGICIKDCKNKRIGAAGKGNVISGFSRDIGSTFMRVKEIST